MAASVHSVDGIGGVNSTAPVKLLIGELDFKTTYVATNTGKWIIPLESLQLTIHDTVLVVVIVMMCKSTGFGKIVGRANRTEPSCQVLRYCTTLYFFYRKDR